jgi:hypothetical protein
MAVGDASTAAVDGCGCGDSCWLGRRQQGPRPLRTRWPRVDRSAGRLRQPRPGAHRLGAWDRPTPARPRHRRVQPRLGPTRRAGGLGRPRRGCARPLHHHDRLPDRRPPARVFVPRRRAATPAGPPRRRRPGHRRDRTGHARAQRPHDIGGSRWSIPGLRDLTIVKPPKCSTTRSTNS